MYYYYVITSSLVPFLILAIVVLTLYLIEKNQLLKIKKQEKHFITWCVADDSNLARYFSVSGHIKAAEQEIKLEDELCIQDDEIPMLNDILQLFNHKILQAYFADDIGLTAVRNQCFEKEKRDLADDTFFFFYFLNNYLDKKINNSDFYVFKEKVIQSKCNGTLTKAQETVIWDSYIEAINIVIAKLTIISLLYMLEKGVNKYLKDYIDSLKKDLQTSLHS